MEHSCWQIGDGKSINFWTDRWLDKPIVEHMNIPAAYSSSLKCSVSDFIINRKWFIPEVFSSRFPGLAADISNTVIPVFEEPDQLVWTKSASGLLSLKDAYLHLNPIKPAVPWCKIWNGFVPPSKAFIVWRFFHNKMPTDENLRLRGCTIVSVCSNCGQSEESTEHLFLNFPLANQLWSWLRSIINYPIDSSSFGSVFYVLNRNWNRSQLKDVILASIVNVFWIIWYCGNKLRYDNKQVPFRSAISIAAASIYLSGNLSKG